MQQHLAGKRAVGREHLKQVGVNKPHTQKSGFFKKPDFSTAASFRFNCAYLLISPLFYVLKCFKNQCMKYSASQLHRLHAKDTILSCPYKNTKTCIIPNPIL